MFYNYSCHSTWAPIATFNRAQLIFPTVPSVPIRALQCPLGAVWVVAVIITCGIGEPLGLYLCSKGFAPTSADGAFQVFFPTNGAFMFIWITLAAHLFSSNYCPLTWLSGRGFSHQQTQLLAFKAFRCLNMINLTRLAVGAASIAGMVLCHVR